MSFSLTEFRAVLVCARAGMFPLTTPAKLPAIARALRAYGTAGAAVAMSAIRYGDRTALVDERGELSFADLDRRSNALANALRAKGIGPESCVGILCRNHRGLLDALFATAKLGCRTLLLNTDFAAPQLRDVCAREEVGLLVHDEEFEPVVRDYSAPRVLAWTDRPADETLEALISAGDPAAPAAPARHQRLILLTSGTTGTPKGAPRALSGSLAIPGGFLSKIPYRGGRSVYVAAPIFHGWGLLTATIAIALGNTLIVRRRFDPVATLDALERHRCDALAVVPIMLSRLLDLGPAEIGRRDTSSLRILCVAGAALPGELGTRAMDTFGDVVYNFYGSTEVAYASFATPEDLRAAPGTVGYPPLGTTVRLLDDQGNEVPRGEVGRIFVGNGIQFAGYTGGGGKEVIDGLMSTGDVGHQDSQGRLFVDGRDDDMIVSGGENVFPREVEDLLLTHPAVLDAAVIGVPDPDYGQRLAAYLVLRPSATLDADTAREFVKANLARYKVPRDVTFLPTLPRNPSGKVIRKKLPETS
ncbi:AMP-binding protein [Amycolatopsis anabasis]|uniref:AMP-binding protein n=1 Tax=Amycolatopsis anabasis TaxID=1840409 RepID=UPI00131EC96C|nr:AMP-binding protein [Amycolatopsis anabasis]